MSNRNHYPVIVIGAGQAGLTMAYLLKSAQVDCLLVGKEKRIGDQWRERYDSLRLFTPRWMNCLPGQSLQAGLDPNGYPDKHEIADALEDHARQHGLNVQLDTEVQRLHATDTGGYELETNRGSLSASQVVIATGPFQQPFIPAFAAALSSNVYQIHTARYRNPSQLRDGPVVVVGCGNSGAQIAVELADQHKGEVHLSAGDAMNFVPQNILGKSIFWWFKHLGVYKAHIGTAIGRRLSRRGDPIIGKELKGYLRSGRVQLHPRCVEADGNTLRFADGSEVKASNIIWATGFVSDYHWLQVPGVLDSHGRPLHQRGVSQAPGLYFLGLPWQYNRASALIGGVSNDAKYLLKKMMQASPVATESLEPAFKQV